MKACRLHRPAAAENAPLEMGNVPVPEPRPGELLIRVQCCGVCRTDLHQVEGDLPLRAAPVILGHQIVGGVAGIGGGDCSGFAMGDRVGVAWLHRACGACEFCRSGRENLCPTADFTGWTVNGGYAEFMTAPAAFALRLPHGLNAQQTAPLMCAGVIGYRALRLSGIQAGQRLGLFGFGAAAHIAIQIANFWHCETFVGTRSPANRRLALQLGAAWAGGAAECEAASLHASIVCAPAGTVVLDALRCLRPGGTCVLAGIHMSDIPPLRYREHLYDERVLRSVANATRRDAAELLELAGEIPIRTATTTFPLEQANEALAALKHGEFTGAAVLRIAGES